MKRKTKALFYRIRSMDVNNSLNVVGTMIWAFLSYKIDKLCGFRVGKIHFHEASCATNWLSLSNYHMKEFHISILFSIVLRRSKKRP